MTEKTAAFARAVDAERENVLAAERYIWKHPETGFREWKKYAKERALIPLSEAWKEYQPISIPDSEVKIELPSRSVILNEVKKAHYTLMGWDLFV